MGKIIGIDLGTSNSCAAVMLGGKPTIIPSAEGTTLYGKTVPSIVSITKDGQLLVGEAARRQSALNPDNTVLAIKRKMGLREIINMGGKEYTPEQISAFILQKIKREAEVFLGEPVLKAVITVPAYFNDTQRQATKDAGTIAGLEVLRLINEPTAAAFAYGIDRAEKKLKIMVYDFGGGTLDVTIMDFGGGVFQVVSTSGDTKLGGSDMDNILLEYVSTEFKKETGMDVTGDSMALIRLREAVEKAKIELSATISTDISLPFLTQDNQGKPLHFQTSLTRTKLEQLVRPIIEKTRNSLEKALNDANLLPRDIDKIILVGGPTRMPAIQKFLEEYMGKPPERGVDPMEAVALGAAVQGGILEGTVKDIVLVDVTPLSLGIETLGNIMTVLISRNSPIPISKSEIFTTAADMQTAVDVHVIQGERPLARDNLSLGKFILDGIPPAPRGIPQIEVTFSIDANGILNVSAKDKATQKEQHITISQATKLKEEEINRLKEEAEKFADEDKKHKEEIETRNYADQVIYNSRKTLKENAEKIPSHLSEEANVKIDELEKALKENAPIEELKNRMDALIQLLSKIGEELYKQEPQTPPPHPEEGGTDTVEGEGKVV